MNRKTLKAFLIFTLVFVVSSGAKLIAQSQITRFAVVDTKRVYQAYFLNSQQLRTYEQKKEDLQAEIDKRQQEILKLQQQKASCEELGDTIGATKLQNDIAKKSNSLADYYNTKNAELENLKNNLQNNNDFYKRFHAVIEQIAERNGCSMVMSLQDTNSILWYSSSVDITDMVIAELGLGKTN